ncbi:hypothetical protein AGMMS50218_11770 [Actinomycetota bacterium]|nr:hypothetical protein AGMMS50218_11770 [Actinomycetota bacterium]
MPRWCPDARLRPDLPLHPRRDGPPPPLSLADRVDRADQADRAPPPVRRGPVRRHQADLREQRPVGVGAVAGSP